MNEGEFAGKAVIDDGHIVIRVPIKNLPVIVDGMFACHGHDPDYKVTDPAAFAKEVVSALNDEDEEGTTRIHKMFDGAFDEAVNQGAQGVELIEQTAETDSP